MSLAGDGPFANLPPLNRAELDYLYELLDREANDAKTIAGFMMANSLRTAVGETRSSLR